MDYHIKRAIVEAIQPGHIQTQQTIAELAGLARATVKIHMKGLVQIGVVNRIGSGKRGSYQHQINSDKARELGYLA